MASCCGCRSARWTQSRSLLAISDGSGRLVRLHEVSSVGAERTEVEPLWPSRLVPANTRLIYLDLNQWIALAKADAGHPDGERWQPALEVLRARRAGWTYVISAPLVMELTGILRRAQRAALGGVIEELTDYACVMPLTTIAALEFDSALSSVAAAQERFAPVPLLGRGVLQAFGMHGGIRVRDREGNDVTARARLEAPVGPREFDRRLEEAQRTLDRGVIHGPADDDEERDLRDLGWDPSVAHASAVQRAQQERDQAMRLSADPRWRRGRLRDVVAARYLALEIEEIRESALAAHRLRLSDLLPDVIQVRRFMDSMRTADVWITLCTAKHRNADSVWKPNDIFDMDALAVAAAYCDVVVTERHAAHVLRRAGVPERMGTVILTDVEGLADHLASVG